MSESCRKRVFPAVHFQKSKAKNTLYIYPHLIKYESHLGPCAPFYPMQDTGIKMYTHCIACRSGHEKHISISSNVTYLLSYPAFDLGRPVLRVQLGVAAAEHVGQERRRGSNRKTAPKEKISISHMIIFGITPKIILRTNTRRRPRPPWPKSAGAPRQ